MRKAIISILMICLVITTSLWLRAQNELHALKNAAVTAPDSGARIPETVPKAGENESDVGISLVVTPPVDLSESAMGRFGADDVVIQAIGDVQDEQPPMTEELASALSRFDVAMDREFERLERREESSADSGEMATIQRIKERLEELDELYRRADTAANAEERTAIRNEMHATMGSIIGLARRDRNERISKLATDVGYTDPAHVQEFVREVDRIYRETHMDWTKLFNRAPPGDAPSNP